MSVPVSVCGLIIPTGREPAGWEGALYHVELAELSASGVHVAVGFAELLLRQEAELIGDSNAGFLASTVHPGPIERCPGFTFADEAVDVASELERWPTLLDYTVCGLYADTGQTYCGWHTAHGPRMAYYAAWTQAQDEDRFLLLANVHEGEIPRCFPEALPFGDPLCATELEMRQTLKKYRTADPR